jgi:hypothetical protein
MSKLCDAVRTAMLPAGRTAPPPSHALPLRQSPNELVSTEETQSTHNTHTRVLGSGKRDPLAILSTILAPRHASSVAEPHSRGYRRSDG